MVIEIALGIVLAVVILRFLPLIAGTAAVVTGLVVLLLVFVAIASNAEEAAFLALFVFGCWLPFVLPRRLIALVVKIYPNAGPIFRGEGEYSKPPWELAHIGACLAVIVLVIGLEIGIVFGSAILLGTHSPISKAS
jgi:hypothetical protein